MLIVAAAMMIVCAMCHWSLVICEDLISSKKFALAVARESRPGDHMIVAGDYESANSINFYEPLRVQVCDGVAYALIPGMKYTDAPRVVLTRDEFVRIWRGEERVFALLPKARLGELKPRGVTLLTLLDRALVRNR